MSKSTTIPTAALALNLLRQEMAAKPGENVVVSPLSISLALGMVDAFTAGTADLTGLYCAGGGNVFVSEIKHKTVFNLDEEGAEGAAVTSVGFGLECLSSQLRVDRDFVEFTVTKGGDIEFANYVTAPAGK